MANLYDLKQIRCKTCGEPLDLNGAVGGVIKCGVCGGCFTLPKFDASQKVLDFLFQGEHDLDTGRFEEAFAAYSKAAELDKTEPEAYWGMALAECKIEYLKDEVNNRLQPICHEINGEKFSDNKHYKKACGYATAEQKSAYADRAEEIDYIKSEFYRLKKRGVKYDCFICVKVTENSEDSEQAIKSESAARTADSEFAGRVYRLLKKRAYEPFYSETVLKNVTGADYEAHILYALATSETMLVICFDEAYLRTKWVKNEYTRFLKLVNDEEKESDSITLVYKGKPIEKLPLKNGKIQGIDADEDDWSELILRFVESHTPEAKRKREEAAAAKAVEDEVLRKRLAEQEKRFKQLEEMLKSQQASARKDEEAERKEAEEKARKELQARVDDRIKDAQEKIRQLTEEREKEESKRKEIEEQTRRVNAEGERIKNKHKKREEKKHTKIECFKIDRKIDRDFEIVNGSLEKYIGTDTKVVIPDGVTRIGKSAFHTCGKLTDITIPDSVSSIGKSAFCNCWSLASVTLPSGLKYIGDGAFSCCGIKSLTIPNSVTIIDNGAFSGCYKLTNLILSDGVTCIGRSAFFMCNELRNVIIPASVTEIGSGAFVDCTNLNMINCCADKKPKGWHRDWNKKTRGLFCGRHKVVWGYKAKKELTDAEREQKAKRDAEIANGFEIENGVLKRYTGTANEVVIPEYVTEIGYCAFSSCYSEKIIIPNSVKSIGDYAFCNCVGLESIVIPKSVIKIGEYAFKDCSYRLVIYCRTTPTGAKDWNEHWDSNGYSSYQVFWGYDGK